MFGGKYRTEGQTVLVTVTDKHRLLPWSVVESRLRELFRSPAPAARRARPAERRRLRRKARRGNGS